MEMIRLGNYFIDYDETHTALVFWKVDLENGWVECVSKIELFKLESNKGMVISPDKTMLAVWTSSYAIVIDIQDLTQPDILFKFEQVGYYAFIEQAEFDETSSFLLVSYDFEFIVYDVVSNRDCVVIFQDNLTGVHSKDWIVYKQQVYHPIQRLAFCGSYLVCISSKEWRVYQFDPTIRAGTSCKKKSLIHANSGFADLVYIEHHICRDGQVLFARRKEKNIELFRFDSTTKRVQMVQTVECNFRVLQIQFSSDLTKLVIPGCDWINCIYKIKPDLMGVDFLETTRRIDENLFNFDYFDLDGRKYALAEHHYGCVKIINLSNNRVVCTLDEFCATRTLLAKHIDPTSADLIQEFMNDPNYETPWDGRLMFA